MEKLQAIEALNQQLIDINNAVTPLRTREQVMKIIGEQLKRVIVFDEFYIIHFSEDYRFQKFFLDGLLPEIKESLPFAVTNGTYYPIGTIEGSVEKAIENTLNLIITRYEFEKPSEKVDWYTIPIYVAAWKAGIQEALAIPLRIESKLVAILMLHSKTKNQFQTFNQPLLEKIAEPIAIGVSNVLLYEEMQAAKAEIEALNQQLMDINNAVTPFRTREQVMKIIKEQLSKFVPVDSFYIVQNTHYNEEDGSYSKFMMFTQGMHPGIVNHPDFIQYLQRNTHEALDLKDGHKLTSEEYDAYQSNFFNYEDVHPSLIEQYPAAKIEMSLGFKSAVVIPLWMEQKKIASLVINSFELNAYSRTNLSLLEKLCEPIAIGVSNVLLYEEMQAAKAEIEEREKEKSLQINLTNAILNHSLWNDRLKSVAKAIKEYIDWDMLSMSFQIQEGTQEISYAYVVNENGDIELEPHEKFAKKSDFVIEDYLAALPEFAEQLLSKAAVYNHPEYGKFTSALHQTVIKIYGFQSGLYLPVQLEDLGKGWIIFASKNPQGYQQKDLDLLLRLAPSLSIAMVKAYTQEALAQREKEKSFQVAVTDALTSTRDWDKAFLQLAQVVYQTIPFDSFSVGFDAPINVKASFPFRADKYGTVKPWDAIRETRALFKMTEEEYFASVEELKDYFLAGGICVGEEHDKLCGQYVLARNHRKHFGIRSALKLPVFFSGEASPVHLYLTSSEVNGFNQSQYELMQRSLPSVSLALENLFAFEDIEQREKEKSLQVEVINAITSTKKKLQAFSNLAKVMDAVIPFYTFSIAFPFDVDELIGYKKEESGELVSWNNVDDIITKANIDTVAYKKMVTALAESGHYSTAHICNGEEYEQLCKKFKLAQLHRKYEGINSVLHLPFFLKGQTISAHIYLTSKQANGFTQNQLQLFQRIITPMALALENLFSFEDIEQREKEKSLQVAVTNALTSTRDWTSSFYQLAKVLYDAIPFFTFSIGFTAPNKILSSFNFKSGQLNTIESWDVFKEAAHRFDLSKEEYFKLVVEMTAFQQEGICVGYNYKALCDQYLLPRLHHTFFGIKSAMKLLVHFNSAASPVHVYLTSQNTDGFTQESFVLMKRLLPSLSLALENLFAYEDIEQREKEKVLLLNLSNAVANITNKNELWNAMVNQLAPVFNFMYEHTFIYLLSADKKQYSIYLINKEVAANKSFPFKEVLNKSFNVKGVPYERILKTPVWIFNLKDVQQEYPDFWGFKESLKIGIQQTAIIRLEQGGEVIGSLHFNTNKENFFNDSQIPLMEAVGKQVSIAIANLKANEAIGKQLEEIKELQRQVQAENEYLQEGIATEYNYGDIIGTSQPMQEVYQLVSQVCRTDSTVLILGETGTGKELIARAIHNASSRKDKLLVKVNCAALPPNLIESELFGHERGSFTGAFERRIGKFELANKGTLFLDEIGELPIELQAKLLRALQEKEIERIGGKIVIKTDVRIIAATNRKLEEEVKAQKFRSDLFFRINIFPIKLPTLHQRKEDIPLLANHFLQKFCNAMGRNITGIETSTLQALMAYHWPGNIRELENVIERAVILNKTKMLRINIGLYSQQNNDIEAVSNNMGSMENYKAFHVKTYKDAERELILNTLEITRGRIRGTGGAAELLQVNPTTLESKMKKLGLIKKNKIDVVD